MIRARVRLARLREAAEAVAIVDPFLAWGVEAYDTLWELADTDELS